MGTRDERYRAQAIRWREVALEVAAYGLLAGLDVVLDPIPSEPDREAVRARAAQIARRVAHSQGREP